MGIITAITGVFSEMGTWIVEFVNDVVIPMFWTAGTGGDTGSLTFLGVLTVIGLAISIFFLVVGLVQNFMHFRG